MPGRQWTPEQRKEMGERMRALHTKRAQTRLDPEPEPAPNPVADDIVTAPAAEPVKRSYSPRLQPFKEKPIFSALALIKELEAIPLEEITYDDCGRLLNALSAASTGVALARRQRQEQLEAGSQRAICKTCGRTIDISRSGGFQILTERDQHHMPMNSYYCSQNCLLARNMPSHARQTPKEKRVNQA